MRNAVVAVTHPSLRIQDGSDFINTHQKGLILENAHAAVVSNVISVHSFTSDVQKVNESSMCHLCTFHDLCQRTRDTCTFPFRD